MTAITVRKLVVGVGAFRAGPFDIDLQPGALLAIVGPNGGGKSTLLRTLAGLVAPISGTVTTRAGNAALLPAPGTITAGLAAAHLVALGRARRAGWRPALATADQAAALEALDRLGLQDLAARAFDRLSSGQQQLVLMARLVAQEAGICLLDEPTAMLDPVQAGKVATALRDLARDGRAVAFATHDIALARTADLALLVGPEIRLGLPDAVLTGDRLADAYGAAVALCPTCGTPEMSRMAAS